MPTQMRDRIVVAIGELYDIREELGRGGMALVFRAIDLRLRRAVAIKVLPPELAFNADVRTRFLREAQTAAQLNHPHIVPIYSVDERDGISYIVMGLVEGESLAATLRRDEQMPLDTVRRILGEVADALDFAHRHGVIHRDVKPDNILLDRASGRSLVTDFGIARAAAEDSRLTVTGIAIGTPAYMSPEQALGEREVDGRSDLYSLGVVAYQMLAGEPPFKANNTPSMLMKHIAEEPRPLRERRPDAPPALVNAIHRALAKRPEDRWADAAAFKAAINSTHVPTFAAPAYPLAPLRAPDAAPAAKWWDGPMIAPAEAFPAVAPRDFLAGANRQLSRNLDPEIRRRYRDDMSHAANEPPNIEERIGKFRRQFFFTVGLLGFLTFVNASTHTPPWIIFPMIGLGTGLFRRWAPLGRAKLKLWDVVLEGDDAPALAELRKDRKNPRQISRALRERFKLTVGFFALSLGIGLIAAEFNFNALIPPLAVSITYTSWNGLLLFGNLWKSMLRRVSRKSVLDPQQELEALAPTKSLTERAREEARRRVSTEVLDGSRGAMVQRACEDRLVIIGIVETLRPEDRALIPDVAPTANSLVERVASLAQTVHRLDADATPENLARLDARISEIQGNASRSPAERDRHRALLERQRTTVQDLMNRREQLASQLENAGIVLANLRLDLIKLRSAGIGSALDDVNTATQEARALSRDIGHVLDAASEIRAL